jgi:hypothetical protein
MNIEEMLREQFTEAADALEPVVDLVPSALREGRRRQSARRSRLLVATVSAGAVAASAATLAAAHIGTGRSPSGPAATAPAVPSGTAARRDDLTDPDGFASMAQAVLSRLFPATEVTVQPEAVSRPPRPAAEATPTDADPTTRRIAEQELDLWWGPQLADYYKVTLHNASGTVDGVLMLSVQPGETTALTVSTGCTPETQFLHTRGVHVIDCTWGTRDDYSPAVSVDVEGALTAPGAPGGTADPNDQDQASGAAAGRRFQAGGMYHDVLWSLTLYGDKGAAPAGVSLAEVYGVVSDMRFAGLIDGWRGLPDARPHSGR